MTDNLKSLLEQMREERQAHLRRLERWKAAGGKLENYPEQETIDDFIERERHAVENLQAAIDRLP